MKIYRPDSLAMLYRSLRLAQRNTLSLGMMACFHFDRPSLTDLRPEPELWATVAQAMGEQTILDEGFPKPNAEFKVYGAAHAPNAQAAIEIMVRVQVGNVTKQLIVSGDRHFNVAGLISATEPFTRMPLTPQTAFGGPNYAANPLGKGQAPLAENNLWPLPNVETPKRRIANRGDVAEPVGFWGFDAATPQRQRYLGQFDARWLQCTWPQLPDDSQPEYFLTAPIDQRLTSYFKGDEALEMQHLHPQHATLRSNLPALRARCFINHRLPDNSETFSELQAHAETVWLFPELACGIVLYRTHTHIIDEDASDVLHIMAEWESLDTTPQSFTHYHALFCERLAQETTPAATIAPLASPSAPVVATSLTPPTATVTTPATTSPVIAMPEEFAEINTLLDKMTQETHLLMQKNGLTDADVARHLQTPAEPPVMSLAEVEKMVQDLEQETRELMHKNKLSDADVQRYLQEPPEQKATLKDVKHMIQNLQQETRELLDKNGLTEEDVKKVLASNPALTESWQNSNENEIALTTLPDVFPSLPKVDFSALDTTSGIENTAALPNIPTDATSAPQLTREQVITQHALGKSLANHDLSGLDLSGLNLSAANFSGCLLENTSFSSSTLHDANFSDALLQGADFSHSDLSRASLQKTSASHSKFTQARLHGAQLQQADCSHADFTAAQLSGADLSNGIFNQANMAQVQASQCMAYQASFADSNLSDANFNQANLQQACFHGSCLTASNLNNTQCQQAEFYGVQATQTQFCGANLHASRADNNSHFEQTDFTGAQLTRASWSGAILHDAVLQQANLDDADLSNTQADGANFRRISAKGTQFTKANLSRADLTAANLFKGSLRNSKIDGTLMRHANLYGVDFAGTQATVAMLEGSNIDQTIFAFRPPVI